MATPNDMTKEILANAAEDLEKNACAAENEADLWRQSAEHMRRHDVVAADRFRMQAIKAHEHRSARHQDQLRAIASVDPTYFETVLGELEDAALEQLSEREIRTAYLVHQLVCTNRACETHRKFARRLGL